MKRCAVFGIAIGCLLMALQGMAEEETWLARWIFRRPITIKHEVIDADLTNFPVLVRLDATNFAFDVACDDGRDARFTLPDNTQLAYDRERHDSLQSNALYWVRLPLVSATNDTTFYLYYGNAKAVDSTNSHDVWTADYVGVWHMNDANGSTHYDASSNGVHGVVGDAPLDGEGVPGMIGNAVRMFADNTDQYIITPIASLATHLTEYWTKPVWPTWCVETLGYEPVI